MVLGLSLLPVLAASIVIAAASAGEGQPPSSPNDIPASLRGFTDCMVKTAKTAPGVRSAVQGVITQDGKALVFVRLDYRSRDRFGEYEAVADFSRLTDTPLEKLPTFMNSVPGLYPACNRARDGKRNCDNVRSWEAARRARGPIPGWGTPEVTRAWENTCHVHVLGFYS